MDHLLLTIYPQAIEGGYDARRWRVGMLRNPFRLSLPDASQKAKKIITDRDADRQLFKLYCETRDYRIYLGETFKKNQPDYEFNFGIEHPALSEASVDDIEAVGTRTINVVSGSFVGARFAVGGCEFHRAGPVADVHLWLDNEIALNVVYSFEGQGFIPSGVDENFDLYYRPAKIEVRAFHRSDQLFALLSKSSKAIDRLKKRHSAKMGLILQRGERILVDKKFRF